MTNKNELIAALEEAQEKIFEAIENLTWYCDETDDENSRVYVVNHLKILASRDHGFLDRSKNISDMLDEVRQVGEYAEPPECEAGTCEECPHFEFCKNNGF